MRCAAGPGARRKGCRRRSWRRGSGTPEGPPDGIVAGRVPASAYAPEETHHHVRVVPGHAPPDHRPSHLLGRRVEAAVGGDVVGEELQGHGPDEGPEYLRRIGDGEHDASDPFRRGVVLAGYG